jgi:hypothetical protein
MKCSKERKYNGCRDLGLLGCEKGTATLSFSTAKLLVGIRKIASEG